MFVYIYSLPTTITTTATATATVNAAATTFLHWSRKELGKSGMGAIPVILPTGSQGCWPELSLWWTCACLLFHEYLHNKTII